MARCCTHLSHELMLPSKTKSSSFPFAILLTLPGCELIDAPGLPMLPGLLKVLPSLLAAIADTAGFLARRCAVTASSLLQRSSFSLRSISSCARADGESTFVPPKTNTTTRNLHEGAGDEKAGNSRVQSRRLPHRESGLDRH